MSTIRVIFIHGSEPAVIDWNYSAATAALLTSKLIERGLVPAKATQEQIREIITFDYVNYSAIGSQEETLVLESYQRQRDMLYSTLYPFANRLVRIAWLDGVRTELITNFGDVLVYKCDCWRDQIRGMLLEKIEPYLETGDPVSIIGHSLGAVVAFDTIYYNVWHNPGWRAANFYPANLFTMGSPIALFSLDLDRQTGRQKSRYNPGHGDRPKFVHEEGIWYNFLDPQDLIAYPLSALFQGKFNVVDVVVQTGTYPRKAHHGYWRNDKVAGMIAERLERDYKRSNTSAPSK